MLADAGSTDGTVELIESWRARGLPIRLLSARGANISMGRNIAIRASTHPRIACTDAGCRPDTHWVEVLDDALDDAGFVGGIWRVEGETPFEKCIGLALHPSPTEHSDASSPTRSLNRALGRFYSVERAAGRSMAFHRDAWEAVGGFPEHLYAGEDVSFSAAMCEHVDRAVLEPGAVVAWRPHQTWLATARVYCRYARGGIRTLPGRHQLVRGGMLLGMIALIVALIVLTPPWEICLLVVAVLILPGRRSPIQARATLRPSLSLLRVADSADRPDEGRRQRDRRPARRLGHAAAAPSAVAVTAASVDAPSIGSSRPAAADVSPRLDVLAVLPTGEPGGAELTTIRSIEHRPAGVEVRALLLGPGPVEHMLTGLGVDVQQHPVTGRPSALEAVGLQRELVHRLRRDRPDVVYAVGVKSAALVAPAARLARVPLVWGKVDFSFDRRLTGPLARTTSGVVARSLAIAEAVPPARLLGVVPPAVGLDESFRVSPERPPATLGAIARLVPYKGLERVLEAAADLLPRFPELRVVIAGGTAAGSEGYAEYLAATARSLGLADRVELLGHVRRVEEVLERLTLLVGATFEDEQGFGREGFGTVLAEANWAGLPVVATTGGGSSEAIADGISGTLVEPGDREALAAAIGAYLGDPELARTAAEAGARLARERFRPGPLAARLFDLLASVTHRR